MLGIPELIEKLVHQLLPALYAIQPGPILSPFCKSAAPAATPEPFYYPEIKRADRSTGQFPFLYDRGIFLTPPGIILRRKCKDQLQSSIRRKDHDKHRKEKDFYQ